jgi:hypothetical protein
MLIELQSNKMQLIMVKQALERKGLTITRFCKIQNINRSQFYLWLSDHSPYNKKKKLALEFKQLLERELEHEE